MRTDRRTPFAIIATMALTALAVVPLAGTGAADDLVPEAGVAAAVQQNAVANPPLAEACGVDTTLVLDASGSINTAGAIEQVRSAGTEFLEALSNTDSQARVIDFGTFGRQTAPLTEITTESTAPTGVHGQAMAAYYNPQPPRQPGVMSYRFTGNASQIDDPAFYVPDIPGTQTMWTNWDQALDLSNDVADDLIVLVTDGTPTAGDLDKPGDPYYSGNTPPNVRFASNVSPTATLGRAAEEADEAKANGTRMLAIGVGDAFDTPAAVDRLKEISGPQVVDETSPPVESINDVDVALIPDFDDLSAVLRAVATELCQNSLTLRKEIPNEEGTGYVPAPGWEFTVEPAVDTTEDPPYEWVIPDGAPVGPQSAVTDGDGFASFQWKPDPPTANSTAEVTEAVQDGFVPLDWTCEAQLPNGDGDPLVTSGDFEPGNPSFEVDVPSQAIVTCTIRNDLEEDPPVPGIAIDKTADPTTVVPGGGVTYTMEVSNTGNVPLTDIDVVDPDCDPIEFVSGDDNDDDILDLLEVWTYTCTTTVDVGTVNTATASGRDPQGLEVTADDTASVEVVVPGIEIVKSASASTVRSGDPVTYTYEVTNTSEQPVELAEVSVTDDLCSPVEGPEGDNNDDDLLQIGETWTYTCTVTLTKAEVTGEAETVVNTATATGTPTIGDNEGDPVSDEDTAEVDVFIGAIAIDKTADPATVAAGGEVTYTMEVTNEGDVPLTDVTIEDPDCDPIELASGDDGDDEVLGLDEVWTYTCTTTVNEDVVNTATATGTPTIGDDKFDPVSDTDQAEVVVTTTTTSTTTTSTTTTTTTSTTTPPGTVPPTTPPTGTVPFDDDPPTGALPFNGAESSTLGLLGLVLLLGGTMILAAGRRGDRGGRWLALLRQEAD